VDVWTLSLAASQAVTIVALVVAVRALHSERQAVARHHGHVVKSQGDGFMMVFGSPSDAVGAALAIQAEPKDGDYFGRAVAIAARVAAHAEGGQVLVTTPVVETLQDHEVESCGEHELRGLGGVHELRAVRA